MRRMICAVLLSLPVFAGVASAQSVAVVELYTSQGCSSCPPADEYLASIADRDDVIALALHVDYWDYLGWKDRFASPTYSKRQRAYAAANGHRTVYTPQMIVAGQDQVIGNNPGEMTALIRNHNAASAPVRLTLTRDGATLRIAATRAEPGDKGMVVQLVRYIPEAQVEIGRGENAGRTISYHNIVTSWTVLGNWDGQQDYADDAVIEGDDPLVVIIQQQNFGPILAAARLK